MRIERFSDLHRMYELVEPLLMQHEAENNFMLGHIAGLAKEPTNPDYFFGVAVDDDETIAVVATQTPPWPMVSVPPTSGCAHVEPRRHLRRRDQRPSLASSRFTALTSNPLASNEPPHQSR